MDTSVEAILDILGIAVMVGFGALAILVPLFNRLLMNEHRETWVQIGSPKLFGTKWSWNKFVWGLQYRGLGDRRLTLLGHIINVITVLSAVALFSGAILNGLAK